MRISGLSWSNRFLSDATVYFSTSTVVNVLNYLFVLIIAHRLSEIEFGAFNTLIAAITLSAFIVMPLSFYTTKVLSLAQIHERRSLWRILWWSTVKYALIAGAFTLLFVPWLTNHLGISGIAIALTVLAIIGNVLTGLANGLTAACNALKLQGLMNAVGTAIKFIAMIVITQFTRDVAGAVLAYSAGFVFLTWWTLSWYRSKGDNQSRDINGALRIALPDTAKREILFLVVTYFLLFLPLSIDQILVQSLSRDNSGSYAALGMIGKISYYLLAPILIVLYNHLASCGDNESQQWRLFLPSFLGGCVLGALMVVSFAMLPESVVHLLLPSDYHPHAHFIPYLFGAFTLYALAISIVLFGMIRSDWWLVLPLTLTAVFQVILFSTRNDTLEQLVWNQVYTASVMLTLLALQLLVWFIGWRAPVKGEPVVGPYVGAP